MFDFFYITVKTTYEELPPFKTFKLCCPEKKLHRHNLIFYIVYTFKTSIKRTYSNNLYDISTHLSNYLKNLPVI